MINVIKEKKGELLVVRLSGNLIESANLDQVIGPPAPQMQIHCKEINRTNSAGVKIWMRYFRKCQEAGSRVAFHDCSPAIVEQINFMKGFIANGKVVSICLPFNCGDCRATFQAVFTTEHIATLDRENLDQKCPKCGGIAVFDDFPEEYFSFLNRP